tara:strand:+ start:651 stop:857 length:207 start_codon:yes stop_codon:yes gene_type:complete
MARVSITTNFNDTDSNAIPVAGSLPEGTNPLPATGAEINADEIDDSSFSGKSFTTEARHLARRLLGIG